MGFNSVFKGLSVEELKGIKWKIGRGFMFPAQLLSIFFHSLDDPGIEPREVKFSSHSTQAPKTTQPPVEEVPNLSWG